MVLGHLVGRRLAFWLLGRRWRAAAVGLACALALGPACRLPAGESDVLLQRALAEARQGNVSERDRLIDEALDINPNNKLAHWLRGEIATRQGWVSLEEYMAETAGTLAGSGYDEARARSADTAASQMELARWCRTNGLVAQEKAHLQRVIELEPDNLYARRQLGYVGVAQSAGTTNAPGAAQRWTLPTENRAQQQLQHKLAQAQTRWGLQVKAIASAFSTDDAQRHREARHMLAKLNDVSVLPLLERQVVPVSEIAAEAVIEHLAKTPEQQVTEFLIRMSLQITEQKRAHLAAITALRSRPQDFVYQTLIQYVRGIARLEQEAVRGADGQQLTRQVIVSDGFEETERFVFSPVAAEQMVFGLRVAGRDAPKAPSIGDASTGDPAQRAVDARNAIVRQSNARVFEVMRKLTGQEIANEPAEWWAWWSARMEAKTDRATSERQLADASALAAPAAAPTVAFRRSSVPARLVTSVRVAPPPPVQRSISPEALATATYPPRRPHSCFVAGTPVWTATGLRPIETLQAGDLVLSQHAETGELAFKAVLKTTRRDAVRTCRLSIGGETIVASGGHPFLVAGRSWQRARTLGGGDRLARLGGAVEVFGREDVDATVPVFNLVVADFHTYFVGQGKVLSHDNSPCAALVNALPGYRVKLDGLLSAIGSAK